jgi:hypothetical protein
MLLLDSSPHMLAVRKDILIQCEGNGWRRKALHFVDCESKRVENGQFPPSVTAQLRESHERDNEPESRREDLTIRRYSNENAVFTRMLS